MSSPSNRRHARYPCDLPISIRVPRMRNKVFEARMLDIGMGGALLSIQGDIEGPLLHVRVAMDSGDAEFQARIARSIGLDKQRPRHYLYGVTFESDLSNQHHLRTLIDKARTSGWADKTGSQTGDIRSDYWK